MLNRAQATSVPVFDRSKIDTTTTPRFERFRWPKNLAPLSAEQKVVLGDFVKLWHEVLPRYSLVEKLKPREHINSPKEILSLVTQKLSIIDTTYFSLGLPFINVNLCIGITLVKSEASRR